MLGIWTGHRLVGVEAHRSNGRVERAIRTIREGVIKAEGTSLKAQLQKVVQLYNTTHHSAIRSTPKEAWEDKSGIAQIENSGKGSYAKRVNIRSRETFEERQRVRTTKGRTYQRIRRRKRTDLQKKDVKNMWR